MRDIIDGLKSNNVTVDTSNSFLLDLTSCSFEVPKTLDAIPVQMSFVGSVPGWTDRVRYHLHVYVIGDRRWSVCEPPKGFNVPRIVSRIMGQLENVKRERAKRERDEHDRRLAEERLAGLGEAVNLVRESPLLLRQDNLRVEGLPEAPDEVLITVRTSHGNAEKIAREFRNAGRRSRQRVDR